MGGRDLQELDSLVQGLLLWTEVEAVDFEAVHQYFGMLEGVLAGPLMQRDPELMLPALRQHGALAALHRLRGRYESWLEPLQAEQLLSSGSADGVRTYVQRRWPQSAIHTQVFQREVRGRRSCLLVGCGALPGTALLLLEQTSLCVTGMDRLPASCYWARQVMSSAHCDVSILCEDAADRTNFDEWDVIFVAALAGVSENGQPGSRDALIRHLLRHAAPGTLICLRSASGWTQLIYPAVPLDQVQACAVAVAPSPLCGRNDLILAVTPDSRSDVSVGMP